MSQQRAAEELLLAERVEAHDVAAEARGAASWDSEAEDSAMAAEELVEIQQRAAGVLLEAQEDAARILNTAVESAATGVLMRGHREVAAILLEARMRVEAERAADTR